LAGFRTEGYAGRKLPCFFLPDETKHIVKIYRIIYGKRDIEKQFEENLGSEV